MMKLMIVDDSNIIRSKIARALGKHGLEIVAMAPNGQDAVRCFQTLSPDLVTMDLTMPHMDGIECIKKIRAINDKARILVISALADKATAIQALKEGALGFLPKPFTEDDLTEAMDELLGDQHG